MTTITKYGLTNESKISEAGALQMIAIKPGLNSNLASITINKQEYTGSSNPDYQGYMYVIVDTDTLTVKDFGEHNFGQHISTFTNINTYNTFINTLNTKLLALTEDETAVLVSSAPCKSSAELDDTFHNVYDSVHWKNVDTYNNTLDKFGYCAIISGKYGTIKEQLSYNNEETSLVALFDSLQSLVDLGFGKTILNYPDTSATIEKRRADHVIFSTCLKVNDDADANITIFCKDESDTVLSTHEITVTTEFVNKYFDYTEYVSLPLNTKIIEFTTSSNVELVGWNAKFSGDGSSTVDHHITRYGIGTKNVSQNNVTFNKMSIESNKTLYKNGNLINTSKEDAEIETLSAGGSLSYDITDFIELHGNVIATHSPLYACVWVKGDASLGFKSNDHDLFNPNDFTNVKTDNGIVTTTSSDALTQWQLIETFVFPYDYTQEQCEEYLTQFKLNSADTDFNSQTIITQTSGDFFYGVKLADNDPTEAIPPTWNAHNAYHNSQQLSFYIINNSSSSIEYFTPIVSKSVSYGFTREHISNCVNI